MTAKSIPKNQDPEATWFDGFKHSWHIAVEFVVLLGGVLAKVAAPLPDSLRNESFTSISKFGAFLMALGFLIAVPFFTRFNEPEHVTSWSFGALFSFLIAVVAFGMYSTEMRMHIVVPSRDVVSTFKNTQSPLLAGREISPQALERVFTAREDEVNRFKQSPNPDPKLISQMERAMTPNESDPLYPLTPDDLLIIYKGNANAIWTPLGVQRETSFLDQLYLAFIATATFATMFAVQAIASLRKSPPAKVEREKTSA